jgi:hypothetical protein
MKTYNHLLRGKLKQCAFGAALMVGLGTLTVTAATPDLNAGRIGYWKLDGNANDSSGKGNHGTIVGATPVSAGMSGGKSFNFNGTSTIELGNFSFSNQQYTISGWIRTSYAAGFDDYRSWIDKLDNNLGGPVMLGLLPGNHGNGPQFEVWNGGIGQVSISKPSKKLNDGKWHMVTATYKSGEQKLYVDGWLVASSAVSGTLPTNSVNLALGGHEFGPYHHRWIGDIDEVSLYSRVISSTEVLKLYEKSKFQLMGEWLLNGNAYDNSGNKRHGTVLGATKGVPGIQGTAYSFNGTSTIELPHMNFSSGAYTVLGWVKSTYAAGFDDYRSWIDKLDPNTGGPFMLGLMPSNHGQGAQFEIWNGGIGYVSIYDPTKNLRDGKWHMMAATYKNGQQRLYVDGELVASSAVTGTLPTNSVKIAIGGNEFGPYHHKWIGDIDDVSIYGRVLTASELKSKYNKRIPQPPASTLIGHWTLDGHAQDDSGKNNHGTILGATVTTGVKGSAFSFSGTSSITLGNLSFPNAQYTINGWIRTTYASGFNDYRSWIDKLHPSTGGPLMLGLLPSNHGQGPQFEIWNGGIGYVSISNNSMNLGDGQWYMFTATYKNGEQKLYINGSLVASSAVTGTLPSNSVAISLGGNEFGPYHHRWIGEIDEVSIYTSVKSASEILDLYNTVRP